MSWILGFVGVNLTPEVRAAIHGLHGTPLHVSEDQAHYVAIGGLSETCCFGRIPDDAGFWAVSGIGILPDEGWCDILDEPAWLKRLAAGTPDVRSLDGHFVAIRWRKERLAAYTDIMGVRSLYYSEFESGVVLSTRLDWIASLVGDVSLDIGAFGAHWRSFNQLSTSSLVRGVNRLGPGSEILWSGGKLKVSERPWVPEVGAHDVDGLAFMRTVASLVRPRTSGKRGVSLGLSGGLDSRLLLALSSGNAKTRTHVFGPDDHPDVRVSGAIASGENLEQQRFNGSVPDLDSCLRLLRDHVAYTQVVSPASSVLGLGHYPVLHAQNVVMIDGGMGEITRRQYLNRVLRLGRKALLTGDSRSLLPHLRTVRADVFNDDVSAEMDRGVVEQIVALFDQLPSPNKIGAENFLDLVGVRTRLPNFFGFEQNRLDDMIQSYMPLAQPSLIAAVFRLPLSLRRNGRLVRRILRSRHPRLTRYPLVKGSVTYPYRFPTLPAFAWTALKSRAGRGYIDTRRLTFLNVMKPFVLDTVHSQRVSKTSLYDVQGLVRKVELFFGGRTELAPEIDWWLAFEVWRQSVGDIDVD